MLLTSRRMLYLNQILDLTAGIWLSFLLLGNALWVVVVVAGFILLVILANAFCVPDFFPLFGSAENIFPSDKLAGGMKLFSCPLLRNSLFLLISWSDSGTLSRTDPWSVILLLLLKLQRPRGLMSPIVSCLENVIVSLGVACEFSAENADDACSCSCCLNFSSSSFTWKCIGKQISMSANSFYSTMKL